MLLCQLLRTPEHVTEVERGLTESMGADVFLDLESDGAQLHRGDDTSTTVELDRVGDSSACSWVYGICPARAACRRAATAPSSGR